MTERVSITATANEFKQYGGLVADQGKQALAGVRTYILAAVGASDLIATRVTEQSRQLAARATGIATVRITPAGVRGYLETAGVQAATAYGRLSEHGAEVVHEFRKDPRVQRVILRAERTVDVVEDGLEDLLEEVATDVADASDTAKRTAADVTRAAEDTVAETADRTRATVRRTAARNTNARKSTATTAPARKAPARKPASRKATADKVASAAKKATPRKATGTTKPRATKTRTTS